MHFPALIARIRFRQLMYSYRYTTFIFDCITSFNISSTNSILPGVAFWGILNVVTRPSFASWILRGWELAYWRSDLNNQSNCSFSPSNQIRVLLHEGHKTVLL